VHLPDVSERIAATGAVPRSSTSEAFEELVHGEIATRAKKFEAARIRPNRWDGNRSNH